MTPSAPPGRLIGAGAPPLGVREVFDADGSDLVMARIRGTDMLPA